MRAGAAAETWTISLQRGMRSFTFQAEGSLLHDVPSLRAVRHSLRSALHSVTGMFGDDGVAQMMAAPARAGVLATNSTLGRAFLLGGEWAGVSKPGAIDVIPEISSAAATAAAGGTYSMRGHKGRNVTTEASMNMVLNTSGGAREVLGCWCAWR